MHDEPHKGKKPSAPRNRGAEEGRLAKSNILAISPHSGWNLNNKQLLALQHHGGAVLVSVIKPSIPFDVSLNT